MSHTCTIQLAVSGQCGEPAVTSFVSPVTGETFHECATHTAAPITIPASVIAVGTRVQVRHCGVDKTGVVETVGRVNCTIRIPVHGGAETRVVTRPIDSVVT